MIKYLILNFAILLNSMPHSIGVAQSSNVNHEKYLKDYKKPSIVPYPKDNEYSKDKELLGKILFFDPRLSASNWISCATCHNPGLSWGDGLPKGIGHGMNTLGRRTPTILNLAWGEPLFWDGRVDTLEAQALGPISAPGEMGLPQDQLVGKIQSIEGYSALFNRAFLDLKGVTIEKISKAIATYERTIVSSEAPFDAWINGKQNAISENAKRGFVVFNEKGKCAQCHSGWRFTDDSFHDIGIDDDDIGRAKIIPGIPVLQHAFKTPTLRNISKRAPYMHAGSEPTLTAVVEFYNLGGKVRRDSLAEQIQPLHLTDTEKNDLVAFLKTLTSRDKEVVIPELPR